MGIFVVLKATIFPEKNNEKGRQLAQLGIKHIKMAPCGSKEQGSPSVMQEESCLSIHFQRMLCSHLLFCLLTTAIVNLEVIFLKFQLLKSSKGFQSCKDSDI